MDANSRLNGVVGFGVKAQDKTDSIVSDFVASTAALKVETGVVELFRDVPVAEQIKPDKTRHQHSVKLFTESRDEIVEDGAPIKFEDSIVTLKKLQVQQQILDAASELDEEQDVDDLDVADSFEESFGDLSGFAAAEGFFDGVLGDNDRYGRDETYLGDRLSSRTSSADDLTGANSLVVDNLMNANNPFMALQGVARLGFITEDLKVIQNRALLGAR